MSEDLGFDFTLAAPWFPHEKDSPYVLVRVSDEHAKSWADSLGLAVRRCYVSDSIINTRATELGVDASQIVAARLPDAGPTMAGDFGEILVYLRIPEPLGHRFRRDLGSDSGSIWAVIPEHLGTDSGALGHSFRPHLGSRLSA